MKFDKAKLNELMNNFYTLTKIRIVIFDKEFNKIHSVPEKECGFCNKLKTNEEALKKCELSDQESCRICKQTGKLHVYKCHAGLIEAVSPLKMNDIHIGYIMFGQIMDKNEKSSKKDEILKYASSFVKDDMSLLFDKLVSKKPEQITAAAYIMETCACYLWVNEMIKLDRDNIILGLSNYIAENLENDLSVDALCRQFKISRRHLYKISNDFYGIGIAEFIRKKRVAHAYSLLEKGYSVSAAAGFSGFNDYNYFSKVFKTITGKLPSHISCQSNAI